MSQSFGNTGSSSKMSVHIWEKSERGEKNNTEPETQNSSNLSWEARDCTGVGLNYHTIIRSGPCIIRALDT